MIEEYDNNGEEEVKPKDDYTLEDYKEARKKGYIKGSTSIPKWLLTR